MHDIFQDMMTAIIKERPKDPIDFLINHLNKPESKYYPSLPQFASCSYGIANFLYFVNREENNRRDPARHERRH